MHWVIQEGLSDAGMVELERVLTRFELPYSMHKVVPFIGEIVPDIDPPNPVIVIGSYSMRHVAKRKGWLPGFFVNDNFAYEVWKANWGQELLNYDGIVCRFDSVPETDEFFMRPCEDTKSFAGSVFDWAEYCGWRTRVVDLGEDDGSTLKADTRVMVSAPKNILREYRLWVVDGRVVTASLYCTGGRVRYDSHVDGPVIEYGEWLASRWQPDRAFVLDVGLVETRHQVIEVNCLNAAGLYAANVGKLVEALEGMGY